MRVYTNIIIILFTTRRENNQANWSAKTAKKEIRYRGKQVRTLFFNPHAANFLPSPSAHIYFYIYLLLYQGIFFFSLHFRTDFIREKKPRGESKIHTQAIGKGKSLIFKDIARKNLIYIYIYIQIKEEYTYIHTEQLIRTFSVFFFFMGCVLVKFYFFFLFS